MSESAPPPHDVSELRAALELERAKFDGLANILPQQVWTALPNGEVDSFNKALSDYFGGPTEKLMGVDWVPIIHPDDLPRALAEFGHSLETGEPMNLELRILRYDGQYRWHLDRAIPLRDSDGTIVKWLGMVSDLTDTREAEHLASIVANTDDAIVALTPDGVIETWNPGAARMFGVGIADALHRRFTDTAQIESDVDVESVIERAVRSRAPYALDVRTTTGDGVALDLVLAISPIISDQGEVSGVSAIARDITERKRMERALAHQALHDGLTGLPNRSLFLDRLTNALARSRRTGGQLVAILFIDLDNFKVINDSLGHGPGDELLVAVANRLSALVREGDTVARFGGDEFVVLCDGVESRELIDAIATRVVEATAMPFDVAGIQRRISASVGIAVSNPDSIAEDLVSAADTAMYRAKEAGRGRHASFDESLRERVRGRLDLDEQMREAVDTEAFTLAYQPILGIAGESMSFEALLRWDRPGHGPTSPAEVVVEAERNGLIVPIGDWVLREACRCAAAWSRDIRPVKVSVNLSSRQLDEPNFVARVAAALDESGLEPGLLQLEITESILLHAAAAPILRDLRELGVATVLDDFGTGYSSLSYLKLFELDCVKIDKTFVDGLGVSPIDTAIVQAVVLIARALGTQVVAEGVEHVEQLHALRAAGCDAIQGFLASRPLVASRAEQLLRSWRPGIGPEGVEHLGSTDVTSEGGAGRA